MQEFRQEQERRAHPRFTVDIAATLVVVNLGATFPCRIFDISLDGCGVRTDVRQLQAAPVPVEIAFKLNGIAFRLAGVMERADGEQVAGVRFGPMVPRRHDILLEILAELEAKEAASKAAESNFSAADEAKVPDPPENRSSGPVHESISAAQRTASGEIGSPPAKGNKAPEVSTTQSADDAASPPRPEKTPATESPAKGFERRAQRRHAVDTHATILFIDVGARIQGRILDLSLSGCRIRADQRFPVGIFRRIETEFWLDGLPFRLGGVIQSLHDRYTVGIRFLDLSARKRGQICELIDEMAAADHDLRPDPGSAENNLSPPETSTRGS